MHDDACGAPRMRRVREDQRALGPSTAIRMTQLPNIDRHHRDHLTKTLLINSQEAVAGAQRVRGKRTPDQTAITA